MPKNTRKITRTVNQTRKIIHKKSSIESKIETIPFYWTKFLKEGELYFDYLLHNFEFMLNTDFFNNHFDIFNGIWHIDSDDITPSERIELKNELLPWIKTEAESGQLFKKEFWKPFRDPEVLSFMFFGYRLFFQYKHYYFQLSLMPGCDNYKSCIYCNSKPTVHFDLAYYGWKDDTSLMIQPDNYVYLPSSNMVIPEPYWNRM